MPDEKPTINTIINEIAKAVQDKGSISDAASTSRFQNLIETLIGGNDASSNTQGNSGGSVSSATTKYFQLENNITNRLESIFQEYYSATMCGVVLGASVSAGVFFGIVVNALPYFLTNYWVMKQKINKKRKVNNKLSTKINLDSRENMSMAVQSVSLTASSPKLFLLLLNPKEEVSESTSDIRHVKQCLDYLHQFVLSRFHDKPKSEDEDNIKRNTLYILEHIKKMTVYIVSKEFSPMDFRNALNDYFYPEQKEKEIEYSFILQFIMVEKLELDNAHFQLEIMVGSE